MPTALQVQDVKQSETALGFLKYHMFLISRTLFASQNCLGMQRIEQTVESFISTSPTFSNQPTVSLDEAKHSLKQFVQQHQVHEAIHHFMKKVLQFEPASFEKDDLSLGHVQFVMFASNLRSQNYALQALDQLQVQKIAGNIVPALATTTSLVAGMVSLEVMKIASERVLERRKRILLEHGVHSDAEANALVDDQFLDSVLNKRKEQAKEYVRGLLRKIKSFRPLGKSTENEAAGIDITKELVAESNSQRFDFKLWKEDKDRILKRFRNSFINIASPLLAFTQPVESESYSVGNMHFNQWDDIELEGDITSITMQDLLVNLQEKYGVVPSSVSFDDIMLYANYLPPTEELLQSSLFVLLQTQLEDANLYEDGPVKTLLQGKKSISLLVTGDLIQVEGQDDAEEQDVTLPPLKIRIPDTLFSTTTPSTELPPLPFETELTSEEKEKEVEMEKDVEKLLQGLAQDVDSGMLSAKVMKYLADQVTSTLPSEEEYPGFEDDELQGESEEESLPTSDGDEEVVATEDDSSTQHTTEKNLSGNSIPVPITKKAKRTIFTSFRRILSKSSTKRKKNVHKKKGKGKVKKIDKSLKEEKKDDDLSDLSDLSDLYASEEPSDQEEQQPQQ